MNSEDVFDGSNLIKASYTLWNCVVGIMSIKEGNSYSIMNSGSRQVRLR
jgi:hypothetical protein